MAKKINNTEPSRPSRNPAVPITRGPRKTRIGQVVSDGMNKTIVVRTITRVPHPKFGKIVKQMRKFYAHDEENQAKTGDTVRIMETRPMSKLKRWRLVEVHPKVTRNGKRFMVQIRSRLDVADNTRRAHGNHDRRDRQATLYAGIGDVITANVKEASANGTVKKGEVYAR